MRLTTLLAAALLLLPAGPTVLRYKFQPGQTLRFALTDSLVQKLKQGDRPEQVSHRQTASSRVTRKIVSAGGGQGVVEETPAEGTTTVETPEGKETQAMPSITRVTTFDTRGRLLKIARRVAGSGKDPGPQLLDGLAFSLPEKPVAPGATWSETVQTVGIDASKTKIPVKIVSRYAADETRGSHPCARIVCTVSSVFKVTAVNGPAVDGKMSGTITYWLASDLGQDVQTLADLKITITGGDPAPKAETHFVRTIEFKSQQQLAK